MQKQTKEAANQKKQDIASLKAEFEGAKLKKKRKVRLLYKSCCGCGCMDYQLARYVDDDSTLKDGDRVNELLSTDTSWED